MSLPYPTRLPVTPKSVEFILANKNITVKDLDALIASIGNAPSMGVAHPLDRAAEDLQNDLVLKEYLESK